VDGLAIIKHFVQTDIFKFVPNLEKINFVETYTNKQKEIASKPQETKQTKEEKPVQKAA